MQTFLSLLFVILSIVGMADSGYLTYEKFAGVVPACGPGFDCGAVLNSQWANIGPIPLSALGFLFYATVFVLGILLVTEYDIKPFSRTLAHKLGLSKNSPVRNITIAELLFVITTFGFLFSIYLVSLMAFVIQAWCQFCLVSAGTSATLFVVGSLYMLTRKNSPVVVKTAWFAFLTWGYTTFVKKIFFLFDAETMHHSMTYFGNKLGSIPFLKKMTALKFGFHHKVNRVVFDGITFPNKVGLSAGFDYNADLIDILPAVGFGYHTIGTVTFDPYEGNKKPRLGRFVQSKSLLVNKGLKSIGAKAIIKKLQNTVFEIPVGISIGATNRLYDSPKEQIVDILKSFYLFEKSTVRHSYYELNISCPNTFGGEPFTSPERLKVLLAALELLGISRPMYIKMPIDQSERETLKMLNVIDKFTIAGVIFGNLTKDKTNPAVTDADRKKWQTVKGNLSGKPTWERSNALIKLTKRNFEDRFTIIGTGGIFTGADAAHKLEIGADMVQLITGMIFNGPQAVSGINAHLANKLLNKRS